AVLTSLALVPIAFLVAGIGIASIVLFIQIMLTAALCVPLAASKASPRTFTIALVALMAAVYGVAFAYGILSMREIRVLRAQYPVVSLESRLAFERSADPEPAQPIASGTLTSAVAKHLDEQDDFQDDYNYHRVRALRLLHDTAYERFAA